MGTKRTGKSFLTNYISNFLTAEEDKEKDEEAMCLETDLGNPKLGLPGMVTLRKGEKTIEQFFIGEFQLQNHITLYLQAIKNCLETHRTKHSTCDLIIDIGTFLTNFG